MEQLSSRTLPWHGQGPPWDWSSKGWGEVRTHQRSVRLRKRKYSKMVHHKTVYGYELYPFNICNTRYAYLTCCLAHSRFLVNMLSGWSLLWRILCARGNQSAPPLNVCFPFSVCFAWEMNVPQRPRYWGLVPAKGNSRPFGTWELPEGSLVLWEHVLKGDNRTWPSPSFSHLCFLVTVRRSWAPPSSTHAHLHHRPQNHRVNEPCIRSSQTVCQNNPFLF